MRTKRIVVECYHLSIPHCRCHHMNMIKNNCLALLDIDDRSRNRITGIKGIRIGYHRFKSAD